MARSLRHLGLAAISLTSLGGFANERDLPDQRELTFTVFSADPQADISYLPKPDAALRPLAFYPTAKSPRYRYRGDSSLAFYDHPTGIVIASVKLPVGLKNSCVLFLPRTRSGDIQIRAIDDDAAEHSVGETRVINLSGMALEGTINHNRVSFPDGSEHCANYDATVRIALRVIYRGRSYPSYAEEIRLLPGTRALVLLLPPYQGSPPDYRVGSLEVQSRVLIDHPASQQR